MALTEVQIQQIRTEIEETVSLNPKELSEDQLKGHYERTLELADIIVENKNKALGNELMELTKRFSFKGEELAELESQINHLPDEAPEAEEQTRNVLKTPLPELELQLREKSKTGKVTNKALLKAALKENDIEFGAKDTEKKLASRIKEWLGEEGTGQVSLPPIPAPEPTKPDPVHLDHAKGLSISLGAYVRAYADQEREKGKDTIRYTKFIRDLERITRQRLV